MAALVSRNILLKTSLISTTIIFIVHYKRKFVRTDNRSRRAGELHKNFKEWMESTFPGGHPSEEEWEEIIQED